MNIMKIPPYQTNATEGSTAADKKSNAQGKAGAGNGVGSDTVQLSQNYLDLANAQKSISGSDELRADKIQQIKGQLDNGNYQIDPGAIAGKMIDEIM